MFQSAVNALNMLIIRIMTGFVKDEKGDTNFISILIVLGVVVILAGVFMGFKDQIVEKIRPIIEDFTIE